MSEPLAAVLARDPLLARLGEERLAWLAKRTEERRLADGELVFAEGEFADEVVFVLEGAVSTYARDGRVPSRVHRAPTYVGALAVLSRGVRPAGSRAMGAARVGVVGAEAFFELLQHEAGVAREIFGRFGPVARAIASAQSQREKLSAVGELAAGLAHELNNPAATVGRAASELGALFDALAATTRRFLELGVPPDALARLEALAAEAPGGAGDALARAETEDALARWLATHGVADAGRRAGVLGPLGVDVALAERVLAVAGPDGLEPALRWLAARRGAAALLEELADGGSRISRLVDAVREYSYLDRAPEQDVDVNAGLESTIAVLGARLERDGVRLVRRYEPELPSIAAHGSELNQVWTALLENAVEALDGAGTITLRTTRHGEFVLVEVADTGRGIAPEHRARVLEPFFTTKDVGEGSGLGLDLAYRVVTRHGGELSFESEPGDTRFSVRLPLSGPSDRR